MNIRNKIASLFVMIAVFISFGAAAQEQASTIQERMDQRRRDIQDLTLKILQSQSASQKKIDAQKKLIELNEQVAQDQKKIAALEEEAKQKKQLEESIPLKIAAVQDPLQKKVTELTTQHDAAKKTIDQVRQDTKNKIEDLSLKQKEINGLKKKVEELTDQLSLTKRAEEQNQAEVKLAQKNLAKREQQYKQTQKILDQEGQYREQLRQDMTKDKQALEAKCAKLEQELKQLKESKKVH